MRHSSKSKATLVFPTKNRRNELHSAITAAFRQTVQLEIIVMDDGSTDGTKEMITGEFPQARYYHLGSERGPSFQRNKGAELAETSIVFPIDDDAILQSPRTIEQTLKEFDNPRVGAVGIPFINVKQNQVIQQQAPDDKEIYATAAYVGAAHALRREVFLQLGGYRTQLFYMGEEGDYCLRMLNAGYITRLGNADPIYHLESPLRNSKRADFYGPRNNTLYAWHNVPLPYLPLHVAATTVKGVMWARHVANPWQSLRGVAKGFSACLDERGNRQPVSSAIYRLSRELRKRGAVPLAEIEHYLAPLLSAPQICKS